MEIRNLESNPFTLGLVKTTAMAGVFFILGAAIIVIKGKEGLLWGIGVIIATMTIETFAILKLMTRLQCPKCAQMLDKKPSATSFPCLICQIEWALPSKK